MSLDEGDLAMQPLSNFLHRRGFSGHVEFGHLNTISSRPQVAIGIAECIAAWTEIEVTLGVILTLLLGANAKAALAIYGSTENRTTQMRMVSAAAEIQLFQDEVDLLEAVLSAHVRPASKDRDKLAHWCWGISPDFPNGLLLTAPSTRTALQHYALDAPSKPVTDANSIFLVTEPDLRRMATRFDKARALLLVIIEMIRQVDLAQRAPLSHQLASEPLTAAALRRTRANLQSSQEAQRQSPPPEQSGKA